MFESQPDPREKLSAPMEFRTEGPQVEYLISNDIPYSHYHIQVNYILYSTYSV